MQNITMTLSELRKLRGFNASEYLSAKIKAINDFFQKENLDAAVVGLSGGIDSTLVLALLNKAKEQPDSPIKRIIGVVAPIYCKGSTNQDSGAEKAIDYVTTTQAEWIHVDLSEAFIDIAKQCQKTSPWAQGQMVSILRTPVFYYQAAILQEQGYRSLVVGTTNLSEYSIGFYGKASDGMNDLQPIIDIYKSEVYQVARLLNIPEELINQRPEGGVWDGRGDEDMIGATYEQVEAFLLTQWANNRLWTAYELPKEQWVKNILEIRKRNYHKTCVGLPARTINVI